MCIKGPSWVDTAAMTLSGVDLYRHTASQKLKIKLWSLHLLAVTLTRPENLKLICQAKQLKHNAWAYHFSNCGCSWQQGLKFNSHWFNWSSYRGFSDRKSSCLFYRQGIKPGNKLGFVATTNPTSSVWILIEAPRISQICRSSRWFIDDWVWNVSVWWSKNLVPPSQKIDLACGPKTPTDRTLQSYMDDWMTLGVRTPHTGALHSGLTSKAMDGNGTMALVLWDLWGVSYWIHIESLNL